MFSQDYSKSVLIRMKKLLTITPNLNLLGDKKVTYRDLEHWLPRFGRRGWRRELETSWSRLTKFCIYPSQRAALGSVAKPGAASALQYTHGFQNPTAGDSISDPTFLCVWFLVYKTRIIIPPPASLVLFVRNKDLISPNQLSSPMACNVSVQQVVVNVK